MKGKNEERKKVLKRLVYLCLLIFTIRSWGKEMELFQGIKPGMKWEEIQTILVKEEKSKKNEMINIPDAFAYKSTMLLLINGKLNNKIKIGIVLNQSHDEPLDDKSVVLYIYTRDPRFIFCGKSVIGVEISNVLDCITNPKVSFGEYLFKDIIDENGIRIIVNSKVKGEKVIRSSDKILMIGQVNPELFNYKDLLSEFYVHEK